MCSKDDNYDDGDDYADGIAINDINYVNYKIMRGQFSNSYSQLLIMLINFPIWMLFKKCWEA